jgi:hypothetical protein
VVVAAVLILLQEMGEQELEDYGTQAVPLT